VRAALVLVLALALLAVAGCGDDGAVPIADAGTGDAGRDGGRPGARDAGPPVCGNGRIERTESCDDANVEDGDGCSAACRRGLECGDGVVSAELGEVCDDGAHAGGDGCASTCRSREACGDGIRDVWTGEVCDDGNEDPLDGCDCTTRAGCGDGVLDPAAGEVCDDGNRDRWDPEVMERDEVCDTDCLPVIGLALESLLVAEPGVGCDWSGDGIVENRLSTAMGAIRPPFNSIVRSRLTSGTGAMLLQITHLEDPTGSDDPEARLVWLVGIDPSMTTDDDFGGYGTFELLPDGYETVGGRVRPARSLGISIAGHVITGVEEDFVLRMPLGGIAARPIDIPLRRASVTGRIDPAGGGIHALRDGVLCGVVSLPGFDTVPHPLLPEIDVPGVGPVAGYGEGCDGTERQISFADVTAGGTMAVGIRSRPTQPDVDLDGDGLEQVVVDDEGGRECHPVIVACIDGDGARIEGSECVRDPRIADGWSAAMSFSAPRARIVGEFTGTP
jgi:cysteine-rich repeat protein